jgi:hypothetical protein
MEVIGIILAIGMLIYGVILVISPLAVAWLIKQNRILHQKIDGLKIEQTVPPPAEESRTLSMPEVGV